MYGYKDVLSTDIGTVDSGCFYLIFIDVFFAIVLFFFKPFTKAEKDLADEINLKMMNLSKLQLQLMKLNLI